MFASTSSLAQEMDSERVAPLVARTARQRFRTSSATAKHHVVPLKDITNQILNGHLSNEKTCTKRQRIRRVLQRRILNREQPIVPSIHHVIDIDKYSDEVDGLSQAKRLKEAEAWYGSALGRHSFAEVLAAHGLKPYMHSVMCGWLFEVCHMADLEIETFILSVALMSRYLIRSVVPDNERQEEGGEEEVQKETKESRALEVHPTLLIDPDNLQLLGIVSLFIAFKFTEASERLNLSSLARLAEGAWDKSELRAKEMIILNVLDFRLCIPTPLHFLPRFTLAAFLMDHFAHQDDDLRKKNDSRRIASDNDVHKTTLFFIHVAFSTSPSFFEIPPSLITAASIVLSRAVHHLPVWSRTFLHHCGYSKDQINLVIDEIVGETMHCPPQLSWRFGEGIHSESTRLAIAASEGALDALKK